MRQRSLFGVSFIAAAHWLPAGVDNSAKLETYQVFRGEIRLGVHGVVTVEALVYPQYHRPVPCNEPLELAACLFRMCVLG
jgi:hypothetical protein